MIRKRYIWKLKNREMQLGDRTLIAGILNVTPDSFSDGGRYMDPDRAFARALEMEEKGADLIDIGAESTRPGSARISEGEELRRLVPVLKRLQGQLRIPISVDTYKASIAEKAVELGAEIINDPSGLTFDAQLGAVAAKHNAGLILNHMRGTPETWAKLPPAQDTVGIVLGGLNAAVHRARGAGVEKERIVLDPGLGFGKRKDENTRLIAGLFEFDRLGLPMHVGPSRKSFLLQTTPEGALMATAAAVTASILNGAHIVRVHDIAEMLTVAQIADSVLRCAPEEPEPPAKDKK
jgi:dihydropteroate synthase